MGKAENVHIAVLGAGPIGIEAALALWKAKYSVTVYERGEIAEHVNQWGHVRLFSPFGMNRTSLGIEAILNENPKHPMPGANDLLTGSAFREAYLLPLAARTPLASMIRTKTEVIQIGRSGRWKIDPIPKSGFPKTPFHILYRDETGSEKVDLADVILDCTGCFRQHSWLGEGGIPAIGEIGLQKVISYGLENVLGTQKAQYAGKSILVVGDGYSAATTICNLAQLAEDHPATWIIWISRSSRSTPLPRNSSDILKERDKLAAKANHLASRGEGNIEFHSQTTIKKIETAGPEKGFTIEAACAGKPMTWVVDRIIANIGYQPNTTLFRELSVELKNFGPTALRQIEPNFFVLGIKSYGRDSSFLLSNGHQQIQEVLSIIGATIARIISFAIIEMPIYRLFTAF